MQSLAAPVFEIAKWLGDPIIRRISYIKNLEKNFQNLNVKANVLYSRRDDIKGEISRPGSKGTATNECENWLKEVERLQDKVNVIEKEYHEEKKCLMGWCPDVSLRLKLGKRVVESTNSIIDLLEKSASWVGGVVIDAPTKIAEPVPGPTIERNTSTDRTLQKILGCIKDIKKKKIGIWGMGGVGKTTVMKSLNNSAEITQLFEIVIWVTVSKDWSLQNVQNVIAKRLSLNLGSDESNDIMATRIYQELERKKFILLLDDMWEKIELDNVGIPRINLENGSKIVLTTRRLQVCKSMDTDVEIRVDILSEEEAWKLFQNKVGDVVENPSIQSLAKDVMKECHGLPLSIIVVGGSLRKEANVHVWKNALNELCSPTTCEIEDMEEQVFKRLKFSFDRLNNDNTKNCFLYGALYPEDHEIPIDRLIEYWRGEGFINGAGAYDKGHAIVKHLIDASLFESAETFFTDSVKMHDVIRDLALRITSPTGEGCRFLVRDGAWISEPPREKEWENVERISLMHHRLKSLPQSPYCLKLLTLFLQGNSTLTKIPAAFFDHMASLRVLDLSSTGIESLPESVSNLVSLRALFLNGCPNLKTLTSQVGALKELDVLALGAGTKIDCLPIEIGELTKLRLLNVFCHELRVRISRLSLLEDLSILVDPRDGRWDESLANCVAEEICSLRELTHLGFCYFPNVECLEQFVQGSLSWKEKHIKTFQIVVGFCYSSFWRYTKRGRTLALGGNVTTHANAIVEVLSRADALKLIGHGGVRDLLEIGVENMNELKMCEILCCQEMVTAMDWNGLQEETTALPNLGFLRLYGLPNLRSLWEGSMPPGTLFSLTKLHLWGCEKLRKLFSWRRINLQQLPNLQELRVRECDELEEIIVNEEEKVDQLQHDDDDDDALPSLLPKLRVLSLRGVTQLGSICKGVSLAFPALEHIDVRSCPNLKRLPVGIKKAPNLRKICGEREWWEALEWENDAIKQQLQPFFHSLYF
ncbi:putative disease resistance protein At4g27220 [Tasmannia lanceolata]|uniref:putative disease resistance protein At4g27220 n=1 Tax=Tasmannia lanceolata TaxID=3420 RepID=UPI0040641A45